MRDRPNDPGVGVVSGLIRSRRRGPAWTSRTNGTAAPPDVASFIAARTAALELGNDPVDDNGGDPAPEPAVVELPPPPETRPRVVEDPAILGLTRVSRSRLGSRLFTWFFVFVYAVILIQLVLSLLQT